ncbi:hypothetical protein CWE12_03450 [Aliidiomarina sedimenti]|uniref:HDOD domain-containing protein n=1 Tax=Aliidiomarina sedimenti TaxID=1933879 RepID=A0ABY0C2N9_9GAMM|nr:hypothetical protein [Aliidiomarina sedimenti]RUO32056.1 hypothetical protein CWE12_03450 [Aliidiomarina sedimenti]
MQDDTMTSRLPPSLRNLTGVDYAVALFEHCACLVPLASPYKRQQIQWLKQGRQQQQLSHLAKACLLMAKKAEQGFHPEQVLARLARHTQYQFAAEFIARAYLNDQYGDEYSAACEASEDEDELPPLQLPYSLTDDVKPMPASLVRALINWPQKDALFKQVVAMLEQQSALSQLLCRYATAYTPQGHVLGLKQSLLLTGPQRSRELVLLSHFESSLTRPQFPLRKSLLTRRQLITQMLFMFEEQQQIEFPCRVELLSWLVVYDAWRNPAWTGHRHWRRDSGAKPWRLQRWLRSSRTYTHRVATRLCQYWQLPSALPGLLLTEKPTNSLQAALALSIASVEWLELLADQSSHQSLVRELQPALALLNGFDHHDYHQLVHQAAWACGYHCPTGHL